MAAPDGGLAVTTAGRTYYARNRARIRARKRAERRALTRARLEREAALCFDCPDDPVLLIPLWNRGAMLERGDFIGALAHALFPPGSVWRFAPAPHGEPRLWQVEGPELHATDGGEVLRAVEDAKEQVRLVGRVAEAPTIPADGIIAGESTGR